MTGTEQTAGMGPPGHGAGAADTVDPELLALPAPPRGRRLATLTLMAFVVAASLAFLGGLRRDIAYFFAPEQVTDLGPATELAAAELVSNTYVRIEGLPMASTTLHYSRVAWGGDYAVFPLAGQRTVLVQMPVERPADTRTLSRRHFSGRLVTVGELGVRFAPVERYLREQAGLPVSSETFVLLADEPPSSYGWAVLWAAACLFFIAINGVLIVRWFRPLSSPRRRAGQAPPDHGSSDE